MSDKKFATLEQIRATSVERKTEDVYCKALDAWVTVTGPTFLTQMAFSQAQQALGKESYSALLLVYGISNPVGLTVKDVSHFLDQDPLGWADVIAVVLRLWQGVTPKSVEETAKNSDPTTHSDS